MLALRRGVRSCSNAVATNRSGDIHSSTVLLFPGQGSQFIGMANKLRHFPKAIELFNNASEILGYNLLKTCLDGPFDHLTRTEISQPAILVTSLAALVKLEYEMPKAMQNCKATAGLSLGEYSSMVFSNCLSFEDAVKVVKVRGDAMQEASDRSNGGMVCIMTSQDTKLEESCRAAIAHCRELKIVDPVCQACNFLSASYQVIGGSMEAIDYICKTASQYGIRKCKKLPVSGAFHTEMMSPACARLTDVMNSVTVNMPRIPVISNVTARPYENTQEIKDLLIRQVVSPVKWQQTMNYIFNSHLTTPQSIFELGPGRNLRPLFKSFSDVKSVDEHDYYFVEV